MTQRNHIIPCMHPGMALAWVLTLGIFMTGSNPGRAELKPALPEYSVKAEFLFRLTAFVEWPDSAFARADSPFVIGVVGRDPFFGALERTVHEKTVGSHPIRVVYPRSREEMASCHVLFFVPDRLIPLRSFAADLRGRPVLTVGDEENFARDMGLLGFYIEGEHVRLEINPKAADQAGLDLSSKLLSIARIIKPGGVRR